MNVENKNVKRVKVIKFKYRYLFKFGFFAKVSKISQGSVIAGRYLTSVPTIVEPTHKTNLRFNKEYAERRIKVARTTSL